MTQEDIEMEEMMRSMEGMEGMGNLDMFSREELMSQYGLLDYYDDDDTYLEIEGASRAHCLRGWMSCFVLSRITPLSLLSLTRNKFLMSVCYQIRSSRTTHM